MAGKKKEDKMYKITVKSNPSIVVLMLVAYSLHTVKQSFRMDAWLNGSKSMKATMWQRLNRALRQIVQSRGDLL